MIFRKVPEQLRPAQGLINGVIGGLVCWLIILLIIFWIVPVCVKWIGLFINF